MNNSFYYQNDKTENKQLVKNLIQSLDNIHSQNNLQKYSNIEIYKDRYQKRPQETSDSNLKSSLDNLENLNEQRKKQNF